MPTYEVTITAQVEWAQRVEADDPHSASDLARGQEPPVDLLPFEYEVTDVRKI